MDSSVIKSFLVGLGFGVDDSSLNKFNKAIASATVRVTALYGSVQAMASGIAFGIAKISQSFEDLGYEYRLIAPYYNKFLFIRNELFKAYKAAGISLTQTVQSAVRLDMSLTRTKIAFEAIYKSVAARFFPLLIKQSDLFRNTLYKNMPKIQAILERFIFFIFKAFDATIVLGERVWSILARIYDFFYSLHKATNGWSTAIIAVIAAWKLLNLSFLTTPLGLILSLGLAVLTLYDDFKTFKEGGQSFINWGSETTKVVVGLLTYFGGLIGAFYAFKAAQLAWLGIQAAVRTALALFNGELGLTAILSVITAAPIWLIVAAVSALLAVLTLADNKWKIFGGNLSGFFSGIGGRVLDFLSGSAVQNGVQNASGFFSQPNASTNIAGGGSGFAGGAPLGGDTNNSSSVQHISQANEFHITSSSDAETVGHRVVSEQYRVNADLARNMLNPAGR